MNSSALLCVVTGILWAAAPLIGRFSAVSAMMMAALVAFGSFLAILPLAFSQNYLAASPKALILGLTAGIINGLGLLIFYRLIAGSNEGSWEMSRVVPATFVLVPIFTAFGAMIFFRETVTAERIIGIGLAAVAIWFLK